MNIGFVIENFELGTPSQQLLDRFLLGYPHDGGFHRPVGGVQAFQLRGEIHPALRQRVDQDGLVLASGLEPMAAWADALVIVPEGPSGASVDACIGKGLSFARRGLRCFVYGTLGSNRAAAERHAQSIRSRQLRFLSGTPTAVASRLPAIDLPPGTPLKEALVIVQGPSPAATLNGLEILLPLLERRQGSQNNRAKSVSFFSGPAVWQAAADQLWSWSLLASAISRSDSPQGDPAKDGRTQDLVRLGLVANLARDPRAWLIEHEDGLRSTVLALDGVVADQNFALRTGQGQVVSAQVYQPPKPRQNEFSRLAAVLEEFFAGGNPPWKLDRSLLTVELLDAFRQGSLGQGRGWPSRE